MNLKDRLNKEEKKPENSSDTTLTSNPQSAEQTLLSKVHELSTALTAATDDLEKMKRKSRSQDRTISKLSSRNSTLTSKTQELQSVIAELRTEISETQNINRSLQESNQDLLKENDILRSHRENESQKEEAAVLRSEISRLRMKIDELNSLVDYSNIDAVRNAYDELERVRKKLDRYSKKLHEIRKEQNLRVGELSHRINALTGSLWLCRDLLLLFAYCSLAADQVLLLDVWDLLKDACKSLKSFCDWFIYPGYTPYPGADPVPYGSGTAWAVRTASVIAILISAILLSRIGRRAYNRIRAQWCRLAARISLSLLIIVSVLGSVIKEYLKWNTAVLFLALFVISMRLIRRYESSYARSHKTDDWKLIKEHNDKSYYLTYYFYYIYRFLTQERGS